MFRAMRRHRQTLRREECDEILRSGSSGVLALSGDDGYPYAVPLSYFYDGSALYFHCAKAGHKLDAIRRCGKASFCVVGQDKVVAEEYTTYYRSVIAFGRARILEEESEIRGAIEKIAQKYAPDASAEQTESAIRREWDSLCIVALTVEHITGKAAIELKKKD